MGQKRKHSKEEKERRDRVVIWPEKIRLAALTPEIRVVFDNKPFTATRLAELVIKHHPRYRDDQWTFDEFVERVGKAIWNEADPSRWKMISHAPRFRKLDPKDVRGRNLYQYADIPPSPDEGKKVGGRFFSNV